MVKMQIMIKIYLLYQNEMDTENR